MIRGRGNGDVQIEEEEEAAAASRRRGGGGGREVPGVEERGRGRH